MRPDLSERPAGAAREIDGARIGGDPECGHERHPDDRAHPAAQDTEAVSGLGGLGQPITGHDQDRDLHALLIEQPGGRHGPARRGHRVPGDQQDRPARRPQRAIAGARACHDAQVPGGTQQARQGGHTCPAMRADQHNFTGRWMMRRRPTRTLPGPCRQWIRRRSRRSWPG